VLKNHYKLALNILRTTQFVRSFTVSSRIFFWFSL